MIRCKITPYFTDGGAEEGEVLIKIEWVEVAEGEQIIRTVATEEFKLKESREGCSYVTRGGFDQGNMQPGTFWIDENGRRHFVMSAESGFVGLLGSTIENEVNT